MQQQRGFTLIEVMVAFMVMAIGLLGVIGLQNTAIRSNFNSSAQMQGVLLAREMADLVRANPQAAANNDYDQVAGTRHGECEAGGCEANAMAEHDKWLWDQRLVENLGVGAEGVVCIDSTPWDGTSAAAAACDGIGTAWAVKLWWFDGSAADGQQTFGQERTTADLAFTDFTVDEPSYYISFMP